MRTFEIEDLSLVLEEQSVRDDLDGERVRTDELTIPISVDLSDPVAEMDDSVTVVDTLSREAPRVYRCGPQDGFSGRYMRYRVAVLGIGSAVQVVHEQLRTRLQRARDLLSGPENLWAKYEVGLFGGQPGPEGVTRRHAEYLAQRLAAFRPNYLVLVNVGQVRNRFADKSPDQLALLTRQVNLGALAKQRPYAVIFVLDKPIGRKMFASYRRACQAMNTFAASMQFSPDEVEQLVEYARLELEAHTTNHLEIKGSSG